MIYEYVLLLLGIPAEGCLIFAFGIWVLGDEVADPHRWRDAKADADASHLHIGLSDAEL